MKNEMTNTFTEMFKNKITSLHNDINEIYEPLRVGLKDIVDKIEQNDLNEYISQCEMEMGNWKNDDDQMGMVRMCVDDYFDRVMIIRSSEQFYNNLKQNGIELTSNGWIVDDNFREQYMSQLKDHMKQYCHLRQGMSTYGLIWELWYGLDTCVRETVSDCFDEMLEDIVDIDIDQNETLVGYCGLLNYKP